MSILDKIRVSPQYLLPQHGYSRAVRSFSRIENSLVRKPTIWAFNRLFDLDMAEARQPDIASYKSLNALFTRELSDDARVIAKGNNTVVCPTDGTMSEFGQIADGQLLQAKGIGYSPTDLLGGDAERAAAFDNGSFATVYLAPHNYHRIHAPIAGRLSEMHHLPGMLFSVNLLTARTVPGLFTRNERVVTLFDTAHGKVAVVLVAAMGVGHMETSWHGPIEPEGGKQVTSWYYPTAGEGQVSLEAGNELGRFNLGSTVVMLFERPLEWSAETAKGLAVQVGEALGTL